MGKSAFSPSPSKLSSSPKMRRHTTVSICSLITFITLSSPCIASDGTAGSQPSCYVLDNLLEKVYFAQVDLIRRGIPTRIVQSEFTWGMNYILSSDSSLKTVELKDACVHSYSWNLVFDESDRSVYVLIYLYNIRQVFPSISFFSIEEYPTLPPMSQGEHDLVQTMWETTLVRLKGIPRTKYLVSDFPFPQNIDVLYDPNRDQACAQYNKFRTGALYNSTEETDSVSVLVVLSLMSVNLYWKGGSKEAIKQMLRHFIGYVFDGIRCLRVEGDHIEIPNTLVIAYSRNIGMITSNATLTCQSCSIFTRSAVSHVFKEEIHALLSYNSWGHLQYAILSPHSSLPIKIDFITRLFGGNGYNKLWYYSTYPELITSQRSPSDSHIPETNESPKDTERSILENVTCEDGYVLMPRETEVFHPLDHCCNEICHQWSLLMQHFVTFSAEDCCARCNQANHCDPGMTSADLADNTYFSFFVPEFGDQDQIDLYLVVL